jgi:hypothetical protein
MVQDDPKPEKTRDVKQGGDAKPMDDASDSRESNQADNKTARKNAKAKWWSGATLYIVWGVAAGSTARLRTLRVALLKE